MINVLEGSNVDLINPFPLSEVKRIFGWNHCYRTLTENDDTPNNLEDFILQMTAVLQLCPSWGIIDKNHLTNIKHEAPIVGVIFFEPSSNPRNGFIHIATARKAFKTGLADESLQRVIAELFGNLPDLLRITAQMHEKNYPAKALAKRCGFRQEGLFEDMMLQNGEPANMVYFGLTKRQYNQNLKENNLWDSSPQLSPLEEQSPAQLENLESKAPSPAQTLPSPDPTCQIG